MAEHLHHHPGGRHRHDDEARLADQLDLDATFSGGYLDEAAEWAGRQVPDPPGLIVDLGAGTGSGTLALARRFRTAEVVAVDKSALMLGRLRAAARDQGLAGRVRTLQADLDAAWPAVDGADLVWAASSLHEFGDQDRVLRDVLAALNPGGLLVVIEMDTLPRFLPDDLGRGRPGLELRCHEMLARMGWNRHPDWQPHLERAGFGIAARRSFTVASSPAPPGTGRYAQAFLGRVRSVLDGWLAAEDLTTLDDLLDGGSPAGLLRRPDLALRARRTAWAGRSPLDPAA